MAQQQQQQQQKRNLRCLALVLTITTLVVSSSGYTLPRTTSKAVARTSARVLTCKKGGAFLAVDGDNSITTAWLSGSNSDDSRSFSTIDGKLVEVSKQPNSSSESKIKIRNNGSGVLILLAFLPLLLLLVAPLPAEATSASAVGVLPTALWAYAHYFSILVITACLAAERTLVKPDMTVEEEETIVKLDLVYGLMAFLLIGSGLARSTNFGKGSEYYLHEILFWAKMSFAGIWGGLSIFPSLTFYKRNFQRKNDEIVPPLSVPLANRLQQIINAEISAILSIPLLSTLMARGVWYWDDFPWPVGLVTAILATVGSFYVYAKQALTWTEDEE